MHFHVRQEREHDQNPAKAHPPPKLGPLDCTFLHPKPPPPPTASTPLPVATTGRWASFRLGSVAVDERRRSRHDAAIRGDRCRQMARRECLWGARRLTQPTGAARDSRLCAASVSVGTDATARDGSRDRRDREGRESGQTRPGGTGLGQTIPGGTGSGQTRPGGRGSGQTRPGGTGVGTDETGREGRLSDNGPLNCQIIGRLHPERSAQS